MMLILINFKYNNNDNNNNNNYFYYLSFVFLHQALKEEEPLAALASFTRVLELEAGDKGEWGFKALKQMIKINFKLVRNSSKKYVSNSLHLNEVLEYSK